MLGELSTFFLLTRPQILIVDPLPCVSVCSFWGWLYELGY